MPELLVTDVTLFDGTGAPARPATVLVRDGRIAEVSDYPIEVPGAQALSGAGRFLLPGLFDTHVHLVHGSGGWVYPDENSITQAEINLRSHLRNGVTTVLDVGGPEAGLIGLQDRVRSGELLGPDVLISGHSFTAPGGHPAATIWGGDHDHSVTLQSTSPTEAAAEVQRLATEVGVAAIKIHYTGGLGPWPQLPRIPEDVVVAVAEEAHQHNLPVIVHVDHPEDALRALRLGVDGLEHMFIPEPGVDVRFDIDSVVAAATEHGAYWSMTLTVFEAWGSANDPSYLDRFDCAGSLEPRILASLRTPGNMWQSIAGTPVQAEFRSRYEAGGIALARAHAAGVKMTVGTDAGASASFHGLGLHREMQIMVEAGIPASDVLQSATRLAAEKLHLGDEVGTVVTGKRADMLLLDANPVADITNTRSIAAIVKSGVVHSAAALAVG